MIKNVRTFAIIPARVGSKRLKNKNFIKFNGRPLINWTIDQAIKCKNINKIIISTDSKKFIKKISKHNRIIASLREKKLSSDKALIEDVIVEEVKKHKLFDYDNLILLQTTSPLRQTQFIDNSIKKFINSRNYNTGVSFIKSNLKLKNLFEITTSGKVKKIIKNSKLINYEAYFPSGDIYLSKVKFFMKNKTFFSKNTFPFFPKKYSDIDTLSDFKLAELKKNNNVL